MKTNIRNIGVLAHVDAGKTTVTEQLLFKSGIIRSLGSVDKGTAHTDSLEVEQQRGISVKAAAANLIWKGIEINIIDTPGHVDFSAEVERSLSILDGAVVVISAVESVQPQTEVYFKALQVMKIPTIIFVNKVDRSGASLQRVLGDIHRTLSKNAVLIQTLTGEESSESHINYTMNEGSRDEDALNKLIEAAAEKDEKLLETYLEGKEISINMLRERLVKLTYSCSIYPVLCGAAIKGIGIDELMEALLTFLPPPKESTEDSLSGVVFKIEHNKTLGKLAYIRLYSGELKSRDVVYNFTKDVEEKVTQIKKLSGVKEMESGRACAGEIAKVSGLGSSSIGDILGKPEMVPIVPNIATPLLTLQINAKYKQDYMKLVEALEELQEEDPLLHVQRIKEKEEVHIQIMGMIQLEILESILKSRFSLEVNFGKPSVIYKETPAQSGYGFAAYTMPKPCWAIVRFYIEPMPRGTGLIYESRIRTEDVKLSYQREVEKQLPVTLEQGLYGWNVIDLKVTLVEGEDHVMHSNPGDFHIATAMGIMDGLQSLGTTLLEPLLKFRITVPEDVGGKVLGDIINMRGTFDSPVISNGSFTVEGEMPAATSLDYPVRLGIISSGKGIISSRFAGYQPVPLEMGAERERVGVNPLDRAKFILAMRNAL